MERTTEATEKDAPFSSRCTRWLHGLEDLRQPRGECGTGHDFTDTRLSRGLDEVGLNVRHETDGRNRGEARVGLPSGSVPLPFKSKMTRAGGFSRISASAETPDRTKATGTPSRFAVVLILDVNIKSSTSARITGNDNRDAGSGAVLQERLRSGL